MDKIVALCKNRGYIFSGSEIYGGLANCWDYGPLGVEFKNNVKKAWLKKFVQESPYNVGLDAAIIMNPQTWVTTGHVSSFSDPLLDCRACKARHRADKLIGEEHPEVNVDAMSFDEMDAFIAEHEDIVCPVCGKHDFTPIRKFNLMFKTAIGVTEDSSSTCYLRPETAQGIFVNFANIQRTTRRKLPFGVCQVGKAFRNEITPGNFIFRVREFEQMELEFFCKPGTDLEWFNYWRTFCHNWLLGIGLKDENLRLRDHDPEELCFYSKATTDFEFLFPFGWGELWGVADRTDYDLTQHQTVSGEDMSYFDDEAKEICEKVLNTYQDFKYELLDDRDTEPHPIAGKVEVNINSFKEFVTLLLDRCQTYQSVDYPRMKVALYSLVNIKLFEKRRDYSVLVFDEEMLLFLVAMLAKNERIRMEDLFKRFREYGVEFSFQTKNAIGDYLLKLNLLERKSDSGEAQYVRVVL